MCKLNIITISFLSDERVKIKYVQQYLLNYFLVVPRRRQRSKKVNLERARSQDRRQVVNNHYRHLYQVRRSNGDVISQVIYKSQYIDSFVCF